MNEGRFTLALADGAANDLAGNAFLAAADFSLTVQTIDPTTIILEGNCNIFF